MLNLNEKFLLMNPKLSCGECLQLVCIDHFRQYSEVFLGVFCNLGSHWQRRMTLKWQRLLLFVPSSHLFDILTPLFLKPLFTLNFVLLAILLLVSSDRVIFIKCIFLHGPSYKKQVCVTYLVEKIPSRMEVALLFVGGWTGLNPTS